MRKIEEDGWRVDRIRGSHRSYKHPTKRGTGTIAGHPNIDLAPGTWRSILKQAEIEGEERRCNTSS
jgi:predicted RNA binding protein YcfA (HicA-like mRNA interferase family)